MSDFDQDDIAAMRRERDLPQFLRGLVAEGVARKNPSATRSAPHIAGRRPGTWPPGISPPGPPPDMPGADWNAALDEHRDWICDGSPTGHFSCTCGGCRPTNSKEH